MPRSNTAGRRSTTRHLLATKRSGDEAPDALTPAAPVAAGRVDVRLIARLEEEDQEDHKHGGDGDHRQPVQDRAEHLHAAIMSIRTTPRIARAARTTGGTAGHARPAWRRRCHGRARRLTVSSLHPRPTEMRGNRSGSRVLTRPGRRPPAASTRRPWPPRRHERRDFRTDMPARRMPGRGCPGWRPASPRARRAARRRRSG